MPPFIQVRQPNDDSWVTFDLDEETTIEVRQPPDFRWVPFLVGGKPFVFFQPTGGDDAAAYQALSASVAGKKVIVWRGDRGPYDFQTHCFIHPNDQAFWMPGVEIISSWNGAPTNAGVITCTSASAGSTTLTAAAVLNTRVFHVTSAAAAGLTVGGFMRVLNAALPFPNLGQASYQIVSIVADTVVTVERDIIWPFANGSEVAELHDQANGLNWECNNGWIRASVNTSSRAIEMLTAWNSRIANLNVDATNLTDLAVAWDSACYNCEFKNVVTHNGGLSAVSVEISENVRLLDCGSPNADQIGIAFYDCRACYAINPTGDEASVANLYFGSEGGDGSFDCWSLGGRGSGGAEGAQFGTGARNRILSYTASGSTVSGVVFNTDSCTAEDLNVLDCSVGVTNIGSGALVKGLRAERCTKDVSNTGVLTVLDYTSLLGPANDCLVEHQSGRLVGMNWTLDWTQATAGNTVKLFASADITNLEINRVIGGVPGGIGMNVISPAEVHLTNYSGRMNHLLDSQVGSTVRASGMFDESGCSGVSAPAGTFDTTHAYVLP